MLANIGRLSQRFSTTIFDKILTKQIPSQPVYEDELVGQPSRRSTHLGTWPRRRRSTCSSSPSKKTVSLASQK